MKNDDIGLLSILLFLGPITIILATGYLAYSWVNPHSFLGVIDFIITWGISAYIGNIVFAGIIQLIFDN